MMFWIGSEAAIFAAELAASAIVTATPETRDGVELSPEDWITTHWADPRETATAGVWAIPAHPDLGVPDGCEAVSVVDWPESLDPSD